MKRALFVLFLLCCLPVFCDAPQNALEEVIRQEKEGGGRGFAEELVRMVTTLSLIVGALFFISWFLKRTMNTRLQQMNASSLIKIVEKRPISPKLAIYLLEIGERQLTLAESHNGVVLLESIPVRSVDVTSTPSS